MLHILHGPDVYSATAVLTAIKRALDSDGMLLSNTEERDARSFTFAQLTMVCDAVPFLAAARLVIVHSLLARAGGGRGGRRRANAAPDAAIPEEWRPLPAYIANMPPTTTLVLLDGEVKPDNALLEVLAPLGRVQSFPRIPAKGLEPWIERQARERGIRLEPDALRLLAESVPQDLAEDGRWHGLWRAASDLDKLALWADGRVVTASDIRLHVPGAVEANIFAWVDAVVERRGPDAVRGLARLLQSGQPPAVLLTMLARGFRQIALFLDAAGMGASPSQAAAAAGAPPFRAGPLGNQARRYRPERVAAIYQRIVNADRAIKHGDMDEVVALETLVADLAA